MAPRCPVAAAILEEVLGLIESAVYTVLSRFLTAVSFVSRVYNLVILAQWQNGAHCRMLAMYKDITPPGFPREMIDSI